MSTARGGKNKASRATPAEKGIAAEARPVLIRRAGNKGEYLYFCHRPR